MNGTRTAPAGTGSRFEELADGIWRTDYYYPRRAHPNPFWRGFAFDILAPAPIVVAMLRLALFLLLVCFGITPLAAQPSAIPEFQPRLPMSVIFKGQKTFDRLVKQAKKENWAALPIGERTAAVGKAMLGTPYVNYTLEIDDRIESPCYEAGLVNDKKGGCRGPRAFF